MKSIESIGTIIMIMMIEIQFCEIKQKTKEETKHLTLLDISIQMYNLLLICRRIVHQVSMRREKREKEREKNRVDQ